MMKIFLERFESFYDKCVHLYNSEESKLKAYSELSTLQIGLNTVHDNCLSRIRENIENMIDILLVGKMLVDNGEPKNFDPKEYFRAVKDLDSSDLKNTIFSFVNNPYNAKSRDDIIKAVKERLLNEEIEINELGQPFRDLNDALDKSEGLLNIIPNHRAINKLIEKIAITGFPDSIDGYNALPKTEKEQIARIGNPIFKENEWVFPDGFLDKARQIILKNPTYSQQGVYDELIEEYYSDADKSPSFSTIYKRLKENGVW